MPAPWPKELVAELHKRYRDTVTYPTVGDVYRSFPGVKQPHSVRQQVYREIQIGRLQKPKDRVKRKQREKRPTRVVHQLASGITVPYVHILEDDDKYRTYNVAISS